MQLSLELGGFPLVDPIFEDNNTPSAAVQQACNLQRLLMKANNYSCRENILHLLASKECLDSQEQQLLTKFLGEGSL